MAFPKAKTKRFNEVITCAPPPGYYNPKIKTSDNGIYLERTERFKPDVKENTGSFTLITPTDKKSYNGFQVPKPKSSQKQLLSWRSLTDMARSNKSSQSDLWNDGGSISSVSEENFNVGADLLKKQLSAVKADLEVQKEMSWDLMRQLAAYEELLIVKEQEYSSWNDYQLSPVVNMCGDEDPVKYSFDSATHVPEEINQSQGQDFVDSDTKYDNNLSEIKDAETIKCEMIENALEIINSSINTLNSQKASLPLLLSVLSNITQLCENEWLCDCHVELRKIIRFVVEKIILLASEREMLDFTFEDTICTHENEVKELNCYVTVLEQKNSDLVTCLTKNEILNTKLCTDLLEKEKNETLQRETILQFEEENMDLRNQLLAQQTKYESEICVLKESFEVDASLKKRITDENLLLLSETELQSSQIKSLKSDIEALQKLDAEKELALTFQSNDLKDARVKFVDEKNKVCRLNVLIAQCNLDFNTLLEQVGKLKTEVSRKSSEHSALLNEIAEKDDVLQKTKAERERCLEDLTQLNNRCESLSASTESLRSSFKVSTDENFLLKENVRSLNEEVSTLNAEIKAVLEDNDILEKAVCLLKDERELLTSRIEQYEELLQKRASEDEMHIQFVKDICGHFELLKGDMEQQKDILLSELMTYTERYSELQADHEKYKSVIYEEVREMLQMQEYQEQLYKEKISFLESLRNEVPLEIQMQIEKFKAEKENWKTQFLNLEAKVSPFKKQLDAYEVEKNSLLSQNIQKEHELDNLSDKYAKLLGHHNINQKIKHVVKIKEENCCLKKELGSLREKVLKQHKIIQELKVEVASLGKKKPKEEEKNVLRVRN